MGSVILRWSAVAALATAAALAAAQAPVSEVQIKAAYLYRLGDFVEWPPAALPAPEGAFVIGVLGADALAAELEQQVAGRKLHERPVAVRRLRPGEAIGAVQMLFVGAAQDARLSEIAAAARGRPVLIVTESESATARGSMINFVVAENKVRFDVALAPAEARGLRISARLLGVARKVIPGAS